MLAHWGNTNTNHDYSTSAYPADRWTHIPTKWRGNHPCYDPAKDIVLPAWKKPDPEIMKQKLWARSVRRFFSLRVAVLYIMLKDIFLRQGKETFLVKLN